MSAVTPWTDEAQEWYERWVDRLIEELRKYVLCDANGQQTSQRAFTDLELDDMRRWYAAHPQRFTSWREPLERTLEPGSSYDTYDAHDFWRDRPHWRVEWDRMIDARGEARTAAWALAGARQEVEKYPTLDAWLTAALRGDVFDCAAWIPEEPQRVRNRATPEWRWPRLCRVCRREFRPDVRGIKSCTQCRAIARKVQPVRVAS